MMRQLEKELGVSLFEKIGRKMEKVISEFHELAPQVELKLRIMSLSCSKPLLFISVFGNMP